MDSSNVLFRSMFLLFVKVQILFIKSVGSDLETDVVKGRVATPGWSGNLVRQELVAWTPSVDRLVRVWPCRDVRHPQWGRRWSGGRTAAEAPLEKLVQIFARQKWWWRRERHRLGWRHAQLIHSANQYPAWIPARTVAIAYQFNCIFLLFLNAL